MIIGRLHTRFDHERESARACGCPSCREKYNLPDEPRDDNPFVNLGAFALLGAVVFGAFKLFEHLDKPK